MGLVKFVGNIEHDECNYEALLKNHKELFMGLGKLE
jgi:hypothetical protein